MLNVYLPAPRLQWNRLSVTCRPVSPGRSQVLPLSAEPVCKTKQNKPGLYLNIWALKSHNVKKKREKPFWSLIFASAGNTDRPETGPVCRRPSKHSCRVFSKVKIRLWRAGGATVQVYSNTNVPSHKSRDRFSVASSLQIRNYQVRNLSWSKFYIISEAPPWFQPRYANVSVVKTGASAGEGSMCPPKNLLPPTVLSSWAPRFLLFQLPYTI